MRPQATFSFSIFFNNFFIFHAPYLSFLLVPRSSSSLVPPRPLFLLIPSSFSSLVLPSSSSLYLPPHPCIFLFPHCLNRLEPVKGYFSSILMKALPTNGPKDKASYRDARMHLKITFIVNQSQDKSRRVSTLTLFYLMEGHISTDLIERNLHRGRRPSAGMKLTQTMVRLKEGVCLFVCEHVRTCMRGYELARVTLSSKTRKINIFEQVGAKEYLLLILNSLFASQ